MEALEAAGVAGVSKKAGLPLFVVLIAGVIGALGSVAALGRGSYDVTPFTVDLRVTPAVSGTTMLSMKAPGAPAPGEAKSTTHKSLIAFGVTVTGIDTAGLAKAVVEGPAAHTHCLQMIGVKCVGPVDPSKPYSVLSYIEQHDKNAVQSFAIKVGAIALAGGFALSLLISLGNFKRAILGALAGVLVLGVLAFVAKMTYDATGFEGLRFTPNATAPSK